MPVAGNTERTHPENRSFFPALDGLRTLAFAMVFLQHYLQIPWGWTGVDLFFVLSGFLITGILYDSRDDPHRVHNFYVRRTLRIFPLYYGVMVLFLLAQPLLHFHWSWGWLLWPTYLGNAARFVTDSDAGSLWQRIGDFQPLGAWHGLHVVFYLGHFWSLCVEEQFYLVWPWVVFWVKDRKKLIWICALTLPVCLGMRLVGNHLLPGWMLDREILYRMTPFRLDALLLGGLVALLLRGPHQKTVLRAGRVGLPVAFAGLLLWLVLTPARHFLTSPYPYPEAKFTWALSVIDLLGALLILVALQPGSYVYRVFSLRPLRWVGRITYGAYVFHDILHPLYAKLGYSASPRYGSLVTSAIAIVSTLLLAWFSSYFFESRFINLKERWTRHGARSSPNVSTPA